MILRAFTDGASRGNPGESGIGIIVRDEEGETLLAEGGYIGTSTNNMAEYTALITLLQRVSGMPCGGIIVHSDSELMVRQVNGQYKVKDRRLKELHSAVLRMVASLPCTFEIKHIPRSMNRDADRLANEGIDSRRAIAHE